MRKNIVQYALLALFLVIFPLISYLYLRKGYDYRLEALQKLEDHGPIAPFAVPVGAEDTLRLDDLRGRVVLASFFDLRDEASGLVGDRLQRLYGQFGSRPEIVFLQHVVGTPDALEQVARWRDQYALDNEAQCLFAYPDPEAGQRLAEEVYRLPGESPGGVSPYFALADTAHTIRRYYDSRDEASMRELVEHLAIVIPPVKERDLVFKREKEK